MRRWIPWLLAAAVALTVVAGCSKKTTYKTPEGNVTVEEKGGDQTEVKVKTEEGEATFKAGANTLTEADLGIPIYPGAKQGDSGSWSAAGQEGSGSWTSAQFTTKDPFDKVYSFYESKVKNPTFAQTGTREGKKYGSLTLVSKDEKHMVQVVLQEEKGETVIVMTRMHRGG